MKEYNINAILPKDEADTQKSFAVKYSIGKDYYHTSPIKEFIDITDIDLERRAVKFKYIHEVLNRKWEGLRYTTDYEFIIWNRKMYRGYIETNVCIDDPKEFKRLAFDFHKYQVEKTLEICSTDWTSSAWWWKTNIICPS